jgi:hypothetical protein
MRVLRVGRARPRTSRKLPVFKVQHHHVTALGARKGDYNSTRRWLMEGLPVDGREGED